jgi:hypothetical protein
MVLHHSDMTIHRVDTPAALAALNAQLGSLDRVVGCMDAEWRPDDPRSQVSIISYSFSEQTVRSSDTVYLLDALALSSRCPDLFGRWLRDTLRGRLTVGFGVRGDLLKLCWSYPCLLMDPSTGSFLVPYQCLDLQQGNQGLAAALEQIGVEIDKGLQCSAWHERPLSEEQMVYAAKDAHVLWHLLPRIADAPHLSPNCCGAMCVWGSRDVAAAVEVIPSGEVVCVGDDHSASSECTSQSVVKTLAVVDSKGAMHLCVVPAAERLDLKRNGELWWVYGFIVGAVSLLGSVTVYPQP